MDLCFLFHCQFSSNIRFGIEKIRRKGQKHPATAIWAVNDVTEDTGWLSLWNMVENALNLGIRRIRWRIRWSGLNHPGCLVVSSDDPVISNIPESFLSPNQAHLGTYELHPYTPYFAAGSKAPMCIVYRHSIPMYSGHLNRLCLELVICGQRCSRYSDGFGTLCQMRQIFELIT